MPFIFGRSGTQYFAMVTKRLSSYRGAPLVESYCKESNISDTNWLRFKNWFMLSVRISSYGCTREVWRARKKRKSCSRRSREQL